MLALQLYAKVLGVRAPWRITDMQVDRLAGEIRVYIQPRRDTGIACPACGADTRWGHSERQHWRLDDATEYDTVLVVDVPLGHCPAHGQTEASQPWARNGSGFRRAGPD